MTAVINRADAVIEGAAPLKAGRTVDMARWRRPLLLGYVVLNLVLITKLLSWPEWRGSPDWAYWLQLPANPFHWEPGVQPFRYSPVAVWVFQPLAAILGPIGFIVGHFALLLTLPRKVGLLVAVSFPFWVDVMFGNVFALVFVAGYWAMRGNRWASLAFLGLTFLMPRPVQIPLALWLVWQQPAVRLPALVLFAGHALLVLATGLGPEWIARLMESSGNEMALGYNLGPTRVFGYPWLLVGVPLAVVLFRRYPAWAGLAIAPYLLPQYWLMGFLGHRDRASYGAAQTSMTPGPHSLIAEPS